MYIDVKVTNYGHFFICHASHIWCHREFMTIVPHIDSCVIMTVIPYFIITVAVFVVYLNMTKSELRFSYKICFKHGKC
jgi:hypothetical protein